MRFTHYVATGVALGALAISAGATMMDDVALFRPGPSAWYYSQTQPGPDYLVGGETSSLVGFGDSATGRPMLGDVNGDGVDDVVIAQAYGGAPAYSWYTQLSSIGPGGVGQLGGGAGSAVGPTFPVADTLATYMGDVNGDGRDDAIQVTAPGGSGGITFYAGHSDANGLSLAELSFHAFGTTTLGDVPLIGDVNGDGRDDAVIYRSGNWYTELSGPSGFGAAAGLGGGFGGVPGDVPMLGDINGDGIDDAVILRDIGSGTIGWYAQMFDSDGGMSTISGGSIGFGNFATDIPMLHDINGDGRDDVLLYREGQWITSFTSPSGLLSTTSGGDSLEWGLVTDIPLVGQFTVPEPTTLATLLLGLGLIARRR